MPVNQDVVNAAISRVFGSYPKPLASAARSIAAKADVSEAAASRWLKGTNMPPGNHVSAIASVLGVTPNELLGWEGECSSAGSGETAADAAARLGEPPDGPELRRRRERRGATE